MQPQATALAFLLCVAFSCSATIQDKEWQTWKTKYSKVYTHAEEENYAREIWLRHMDFIQSHNSRADVTFSLEMNEFGDQEASPANHPEHSLRYTPEVTNNFLPRAPPASFDWRKRGVVSPVRNHGQLGKSDAFAVTEDLESLHAIRTGRLEALSVFEVSDCCSANPGSLIPDVYECIAGIGGLCSEQSYPPSGSPACRNNSCEAVSNDANTTVHIPRGDETRMVMAVLERPLVVHIDASRPSFQFYKAGVYEDTGCSKRVDHALQLVGYGVDTSGKPYWILKNSWGQEWGNEGYILLKRGVNMCGIADFAIYPQ